MKILTRDFGELDIDEAEVIAFRSPIYGFDDLKQFVILYDDSIPGPFSWLQSVEKPDICFILVDPDVVVKDGYNPQLPKEAVRLLEADNETEMVWRAIAVIPKDFSQATMNLKSPIVINPSRKCAAQVILDAEYPLRARLIGEDTSC